MRTILLALLLCSCDGTCASFVVTSGAENIVVQPNKGATWTDLGQQFSQTHIYSLADLGGGVVVAGTYPSGKILRSTSGGNLVATP